MATLYDQILFHTKRYWNFLQIEPFAFANDNDAEDLHHMVAMENGKVFLHKVLTRRFFCDKFTRLKSIWTYIGVHTFSGYAELLSSQTVAEAIRRAALQTGKSCGVVHPSMSERNRRSVSSFNFVDWQSIDKTRTRATVAAANRVTWVSTFPDEIRYELL